MDNAKKPSRASATDSSAVGSIRDAIANIQANAGPKGLSMYETRAIEKLETAERMLSLGKK